MINDRVLGLLGLILAVVYGLHAQEFQPAFGGGGAIGPSAFPTLLAVLLAISCIYLMVKPDPDEAWPPLKTLVELALILAVLLGFVVILEPLGFILSAGLAVTLLAWRMNASLKPAALVGFCSSVFMFALFTYGLDLALPVGTLWGMN
ncbi:tripartite tricarboxylate transporter TctB family protein [Zobellella iuensis]|uniref:Tripartite tricarboxylate transporter TctB family protein n=1 Tax=Zobellella iuensis TaxID=2803811 RepID=A0ABS1QPD8_9GAMM|nr:tripartite tricarboxylate transporter TctB family protein [Zobellella iuensis]MBL1376382.1 tripartite tricarboxylate transporter TctB family protein [Zobellella iuensis]